MLADISNFHKFIVEKFNLTKENKWISFGASYAGLTTRFFFNFQPNNQNYCLIKGSLSAWFRLKYPSLVHAALSSSAPMVAKINFKEYLQEVGQYISNYSPICTTNIFKAFKKVQELVNTQIGMKKIKQMFRFELKILTFKFLMIFNKYIGFVKSLV